MKKNKGKYNIVFEKLEELYEETSPDTLTEGDISEVQITSDEFEEIDELRRLSAEIAQPTLHYSTRT